MANKERVIAAIEFQNPDYRKTIHNHITFVDLGKAQEEIWPGYFRDEFGVNWNKTGVDKDIGVIDSILPEEPEDLVDFVFPRKTSKPCFRF